MAYSRYSVAEPMCSVGLSGCSPQKGGECWSKGVGMVGQTEMSWERRRGEEQGNKTSCSGRSYLGAIGGDFSFEPFGTNNLK